MLIGSREYLPAKCLAVYCPAQLTCAGIPLLGRQCVWGSLSWGVSVDPGMLAVLCMTQTLTFSLWRCLDPEMVEEPCFFLLFCSTGD